MANTDSLIGYGTGSIINPTFSDSSIGAASGSITAYLDPPAQTRSDSLIGFAKGAMGTAAGRSDSLIGSAGSTMVAPHTPLLVMVDAGPLREVPILTWDGSALR